MTLFVAKLVQCVKEHSVPHQDGKVFFDGVGLARQGHDQSSIRKHADNGSRQARHPGYLKSLALHHLVHRICSSGKKVTNGLWRQIARGEARPTRSQDQVDLAFRCYSFSNGPLNLAHFVSDYL